MTVRLTRQQHRVLSFCALGLWDGEIAERMGLKRRTVKFHMLKCIEAFGVHNRTAAVSRALVWGLLPEAEAALRAMRDTDEA